MFYMTAIVFDHVRWYTFMPERFNGSPRQSYIHEMLPILSGRGGGVEGDDVIGGGDAVHDVSGGGDAVHDVSVGGDVSGGDVVVVVVGGGDDFSGGGDAVGGDLVEVLLFLFDVIRMMISGDIRSSDLLIIVIDNLGRARRCTKEIYE